MIKVKLVKKPIKGDKISFLLKFSPPIRGEHGEQKTYVATGIHIPEKPKSASEKIEAEHGEELATRMRIKWENEVNKPEIYSGPELASMSKQEDVRVETLINHVIGLNKISPATFNTWITFKNTFLKVAGEDITILKLSPVEITKYIHYISSKLSNSTVILHLTKLKRVLSVAKEEGYLVDNLIKVIKMPKATVSKRNFLTVEEVKKLLSTDYKSNKLKSACLFSALTGLRFSDIVKLTDENFTFRDGNMYIEFCQKKTGNHENLPVNEMAYNIYRDVNGFESVAGIHNGVKKKIIDSWLEEAGIKKEITFHCFRHTFATMQLTLGTDLYTVSKMLGHKSISTTQIYANVVDSKKVDAANKLNNL